jgi:hypothetical protein
LPPANNKAMALLDNTTIEAMDHRAQALAARNAERTPRFLNARTRAIGVDVDALDQQVEEKKQSALKEKRQLEEEARAQQALLKHHKAEEKEIDKKNQLKQEEVNATLAEQVKVKLRQSASHHDSTAAAVDADGCGLASLQWLSGEDQQFKDRERQKQEQAQTWCAAQVFERELRKRKEVEARHLEAVEISEITKKQELKEAELSRSRTAQLRAIQEENLRKANEKKTTKEHETERKLVEERDVVMRDKTDTFLAEKSSHISALSEHRVRPDHFKGLNDKERRAIFRGNDALIDAKKRAVEEEAKCEERWADKERMALIEQDCIQRQIDQKKLEANTHQVTILQQQQREAKERHEENRKEIFGSIQTEFFQNFGTSCR